MTTDKIAEILADVDEDNIMFSDNLDIPEDLEDEEAEY